MTAVLPETYAAAAAALAGAVVIIRKLLSRKQPPKLQPVTTGEFHQQMESMRNRIGASYLALDEKIDARHKELLSAISNLAATTEQRLDRLDSTVARLDERTKVF